MEQQWLSVLQGVMNYEKNSMHMMSILFSVVIVIVMAVAVLRFKKEKVHNRIIMCCVVVLLCTVFGIYLFTNYQYLQTLQTDMVQCSFVSYSGSFIHDNYQRDSFYHNFIILSNGETLKTLRYPDYGNQYHLHQESQDIPVGTWTGTVVYGENSNVVVYCITERD